MSCGAKLQLSVTNHPAQPNGQSLIDHTNTLTSPKLLHSSFSNMYACRAVGTRSLRTLLSWMHALVLGRLQQCYPCGKSCTRRPFIFAGKHKEHTHSSKHSEPTVHEPWLARTRALLSWSCKHGVACLVLHPSDQAQLTRANCTLSMRTICCRLYRARGIPAPVTLPLLPPLNENPKDSINQLAEGFVNSLQVRLSAYVCAGHSCGSRL